ncbi:MAG: serine protease [Rhodobacteraceae bacterium]|nr:serine protease [Paracoccaceae bacterium]
MPYLLRAAVLLIFLLLVPAPASAQGDLADPFEAAALTAPERRFVQAALAFGGHYRGLIDGDWGAQSAAAMEDFSRARFAEPPRNWHLAVLAFEFLEAHDRDGWQMDYLDVLDMSLMFPGTAIRADPPTEHFVNLAHTASSLSYSFAVTDRATAARLHDYTAARHAAPSAPYVLRRKDLAITSTTDRNGVILYTRTDLRRGAWSVIMVSAGARDAALLNAVTASITPGRAPRIGIPEGGWLDGLIRSAVALLEEDKGREVTAPPAVRGAASEPPPAPGGSSGSGFRVSEAGHVLTNAHVVERCSAITVNGGPALLVASSAEHDLALLLAGAVPGQGVAAFAATPARLNSDVTAAGFPLSGLLSGLNVTRGSVSALSGIGGNLLHMQITAPLQAGNSGGPVLSSEGLVVGVAVSKLDAQAVAAAYGDLPQNVNFAIRGEVARLFLMQNGIEPMTATDPVPLTPEALAQRAQGFTVVVACD